MFLVPGATCGELLLPDECVDWAFQVGSSVATALGAAMQPFFPDEVGDCDPLVSFFSHAERAQPDDLCNQIVVSIVRISPRGRQKGFTHWHLVYRVEAIFSGFPMIEQVDDKVYVPRPEDQEIAARWLAAVGMALAGALHEELHSPTVFSKCDAIEMTDMLPLGPRGGCAGWATSFTIDRRPD